MPDMPLPSAEITSDVMSSLSCFSFLAAFFFLDSGYTSSLAVSIDRSDSYGAPGGLIDESLTELAGDLAVTYQYALFSMLQRNTPLTISAAFLCSSLQYAVVLWGLPRAQS